MPKVRIDRGLEPCEPGPLKRRQAAPGGRGGPPTELPRGPSNEHIVTRGVQHPVVSLPGVVIVPGDLDEALVQTEIVSNRVLPALLIVLIIREILHDEFINPVQGESFLGTTPNGHHYQGVVTEGRLLRLLTVAGLRRRVVVVIAVRIVDFVIVCVIVFCIRAGGL